MNESAFDLSRSVHGVVHTAWQALLNDPTQLRQAVRPKDGATRPPAFVTISFDGAVPVPGMHVRLEPRSRGMRDISYRGFTLETKRNQLLGADGEPADWAIIECGDAALTDLFLKFSERVLELVVEGRLSPSEAIRSGIRSWLDFFKRNGSQLDRERLTGLFGELSLLDEILRHTKAYPSSLNGWLGPEGATWDFSLVAASVPLQIEVKTTLKPNTKVSINGLDQLWARDDSVQYWLNFRSLHYHDQDDTAPLGSIVELVDNIKTKLLSHAPEMVPEYREKLELAGLFEHHYEAYYRYKFSTYQSRWLQVTKDFPGLHRSQVPEIVADRVEHIKYTLNLNGIDWAEDPLGL